MLTKAEKKFNVLVTIDKNLSYQQKVSTFDLAVIALEANSNRYKVLLGFVECASEALKSAKKGTIRKWVFEPNKTKADMRLNARSHFLRLII